MTMDEQLPAGWVQTTLGMLGEYINGYAFNDELWSEKGRPIIRIQDLTGTRNTPNYFAGEIEEKYLVQPGDFLVAWSATLGAFIWRGPEAWLNQHIFKVISYIDKLFHYYLTQTVIDELYQKAHGSGMVHVTRGIFEATKVLLPPFPEQARIVAAIEQQFSRIDSAVASLQSAQAKAKQYRASLLRSAVEGELTSEWRAANPVSETGEQLLARILAERRARWEAEQLAKMREKGNLLLDDAWKQKYKEPQGPDVEKLPELPEGWCWATVEQLAQIQGGIQKQPGRAPRQNAYPYLRVANVLRGKLDLSVMENMELFGNELETLRLKIGDLLIVEGNGSKTEIGRSALWNGEIENCVHQNHVIRVRLHYISPDYVDFYWNSPMGNQRVMDVAASTTGLYTLSVSKISRLPVPLPPLDEQAQIVAEVEARLSEIAQTEETIEHSLRRAERERQSILREAFAGRLVAQNPEDEPASVLLERIREERKKRDAIEKERRKGKQRMTGSKKGQAYKSTKERVYHTLKEAGTALKPEELFKQAGFKVEEQPESVEKFQVALTPLEEAGAIEETKLDNHTVVLEARELPEETMQALFDAPDEDTEEVVDEAESGASQASLWDA